MGNPFDFISGLFRSDQQDPSTVPAPDREPLPQADPSYRTSLFEPQGGTGTFAPFGFMGRMMGVPTTGERAGMVNQMAMQELAKLRDQGVPADKAIMTFVQSPKGQDWMGSGTADVKGVLGDFVNSTMPRPPIQQQHIAPGNIARSIDPNSGEVTTVKNPTTEAQNFETYRNIAQLPDADLREMASYHMMTPEQRQNRQPERAMKRLVDGGMITQQEADMFLTGALKIENVPDRWGKKSGTFVVINPVTQEMRVLRSPAGNSFMRSDPRSPGVPAPGEPEGLGPSGVAPGVQPRATFAPGAAPGLGTGEAPGPEPAGQRMDETLRRKPPSGIPSDIPDDAYLPDGRVDWSKTTPRARMWLGVGAKSLVTDIGTRLQSFIDPSKLGPNNTGQMVQEARAQFYNFRQALSGMAATGNQLGIPSDLVRQVKDLAEGTGWTDDPAAAAIQGNLLSTRLAQEIAVTRNALANDTNASDEQMKRWEGQIETYTRVLRQLPSPEDTQTFIKLYNQGKTDYQSLGEAFKAATTSALAIKNDLIGGPKPLTTEGQAVAKTYAASTSGAELMQLAEDAKKNDKLSLDDRRRLDELIVLRATELQDAIRSGKGSKQPAGKPTPQTPTEGSEPLVSPEVPQSKTVRTERFAAPPAEAPVQREQPQEPPIPTPQPPNVPAPQPGAYFGRGQTPFSRGVPRPDLGPIMTAPVEAQPHPMVPPGGAPRAVPRAPGPQTQEVPGEPPPQPGELIPGNNPFSNAQGASLTQPFVNLKNTIRDYVKEEIDRVLPPLTEKEKAQAKEKKKRTSPFGRRYEQ